mgnify:CR=1 FL=1
MIVLPPSTVSRLGVMPHCARRKIIADRAIPLTIKVMQASAINKYVLILLILSLDVSAIEKKIIARTPINNKLKIIIFYSNYKFCLFR